MEDLIIYNILGIIAVFIPLYLLLTVGPEISKRRLIYGIVGLTTAAIIGLFLYLLAIDELLGLESLFSRRLAREITAAITEELIRYPGILFAVYLVGKLDFEDPPQLELQPTSYVEGDFTTIIDPHGMGMFFGTGYGLGETIAFYVYPTLQELISGEPTFYLATELNSILYRITAVMAHIALTYLAMAITSQKGFWRVTIILHLVANVANRVFINFSPNEFSIIVFTMFTRFAIVLIAYFLLRPKVRYLSPAVLVFLLTALFLLIVLISTFIALLVGFIGSNIFQPF